MSFAVKIRSLANDSLQHRRWISFFVTAIMKQWARLRAHVASYFKMAEQQASLLSFVTTKGRLARDRREDGDDCSETLQHVYVRG